MPDCAEGILYVLNVFRVVREQCTVLNISYIHVIYQMCDFWKTYDSK